MKKVTTLTYCFKNKKRNDSESYFYSFKSWHAKADKPLENKAKKEGGEIEHGQKGDVEVILCI